MASFVDNALDGFGKIFGLVGDVYSALTAEDKTSTTIGAIGGIVATAIAVGIAGPTAATVLGIGLIAAVGLAAGYAFEQTAKALGLTDELAAEVAETMAGSVSAYNGGDAITNPEDRAVPNDPFAHLDPGEFGHLDSYLDERDARNGTDEGTDPGQAAVNAALAAAAAVAYGGGEYGGGGNTAASDAVGYGGGEYGGGSTPSEEESGEGLDPGEEDPGGDDGGGGGSAKPIMLDLDGDGVELVALDDSTAFYDINGDGYRERVAWASADDGFLAYDRDGDGAISAHDELSFVSYVEGAQTDLEGLRHFDTTGNGQLDSGDVEWDKFRVWQDLDQNGESDPGELRTLAEAGIASISLTSDGVEQTVAGNTVFGEGRLLAGAGIIAFNQRHRNLPAVCRLQRRHLISQAGEVDVDAAGFRVFAADCDLGGGGMDDLAFHGVEREILRRHAHAPSGRKFA